MKNVRFAAAISLVLASCTTVRHAPAPFSAPACGTWRVVSSPNVGAGDNFLSGVAGSASSDVWAVGIFKREDGLARTLTEHWDGTTWRVVPSADPAGADSFLNSAVALSPSDVWAVGIARGGDGAARTLVEHWDGSAWSVVPSPSVGTGDNYLDAVAAYSPSDAWAVGSFVRDGLPRSLVLHWDGASWRQARAFEPAGGSGLSAVAVSARNDVWAVGGYAPPQEPNQPLVVHWDGSRWRRVASPVGGPHGSGFSGVTASPSRLWAVGGARVSGGDLALVALRDGARWTLVSRQPVGRLTEDLNDVDGAAVGQVWAVGAYSDGGVSRTLVERGTETAWSSVQSPNVAGADNRLAGVEALSSGDVWAVGNYSRGPDDRTLIEHYCPG